MQRSVVRSNQIANGGDVDERTRLLQPTQQEQQRDVNESQIVRQMKSVVQNSSQKASQMKAWNPEANELMDNSDSEDEHNDNREQRTMENDMIDFSSDVNC